MYSVIVFNKIVIRKINKEFYGGHLLIYIYYRQLFFCWKCEEELWQERMERILIKKI